jgi:hypothetical protein
LRYRRIRCVLDSVLPLLPVFLIVAVASTVPVPRVNRMQAITPCRTIAKADVESATGRRIARAVETEEGATCDYSGKNARVTITARRLPAGFDFDREMVSLRSAIPGATVRFVSGMGVRAAFVDIQATGTQLHLVTESNLYVMISVMGAGDVAEMAAAAETLARRLLDVV